MNVIEKIPEVQRSENNICMFVGEYAIAGGGASNWDKESTKQRMITMCQIKNLIQRSKGMQLSISMFLNFRV